MNFHRNPYWLLAKLSLAFIAALQLVACSKPEETMTTKNIPPVAKKIPYEMTQHGHTRIDNYYWMRDDKRENTEVLAHLAAENAYLDAELQHTKLLQETLYDEMTGRLKKDDASVPYFKNGYWWYRKFEGDKEYPIYARKSESLDATEEMLLDVNVLAKGHDYFRVGTTSTSPNNQLMAYSVDTVSRRIYDIVVKNLTNGELLADKLEQTSGSIVWANDNKHLFYIKKHPQTLLAYQVYRHKLGTSQDEDVLMYEESDNTYYTSIGKTRDDQYIYIWHDSTNTKGMSFLSANEPDSPFKPLIELQDGLEYAAENKGEWFYIWTNKDAQNFKIMKVKAQDSQDMSKWQEVIPHREDVYIEDFIVLNDFMVLEEKQRGVTNIRVIEFATGKQSLLPFNDPAYVATFSTNVAMDTNKLRLYYSSLTTPSSILEYDLNELTYTTLKQDEVLGEFNSEWYASERIFVPARDGKEVPVSIVYRKDKFKKDGTNPVYQYAYGSYGSTIEPYFSASRLSLLDRGFVFALAHIRGGQMLGRQWYEDGKMFNKMNTFTDFIDVTKQLTTLGYGDKNKMFAVGGSAGGLLMGAVVNMAPELYLGVAAHVPFVDVVTTMSDPSIPLTTGEYDEWGNPANKDSYEYMLSYSPYDQVTKQDYPNILVTTGLHDSQVQYFEPMKWVAKLREYKTDDNDLYFLTNMEAGHGGASGRFRRFKERALEYAYFMDLAGIKE